MSEVKMSAGQTVSYVPELLEDILLHLPLWELMNASQVNEQFARTVDRSSLIQRALTKPAKWPWVDWDKVTGWEMLEQLKKDEESGEQDAIDAAIRSWDEMKQGR